MLRAANAKSTVVTWLDSTPFLVTLPCAGTYNMGHGSVEKEKPSRSVVLRKTQSSCAAGCIENEAWIIREEQ